MTTQSPPPFRIGIIADDLTGAAELAGVAWRFGLSAEIHLRSVRPANASVIAVDTDSRHCSPAEASGRVAAAAHQLLQLGVAAIYKKVDSVLRGWVVVEIESILEKLQLNRALLVPANPGLGRTIQAGHYLIDNRPIHETDFRNDPHHPRQTSQVPELLGPARRQPVAVAAPNQTLLPSGIVVGEVACRADLLAWAARLDPTTLPAGGGEFFASLLEHQFGRAEPRLTRSPAEISGPTLFVCGSATVSTREFLQHCRQSDWPVFPMPMPLFAGTTSHPDLIHAWADEISRALAGHPVAIVAIDRPLAKSESVRLTAALIAAVQEVIRSVPIGQINIEGGATAAALLSAAGWQQLPVIREIAQGVVTLRAGPGSLAITMKPGSYRWPQHIVTGKPV